jgi:uncharacterized protein YbbC (DUF1343 family)
MKIQYIFFIVLFSQHTLQALYPFKLGLENIPENFGRRLQEQGIRSVGLITNHTGIDQQGNRNIDILLQKKVPITAIFAPEHGITGIIEASKKVPNTIDEKTKLPIIGLYDNKSGKKIDLTLLQSIDLFIFDIQDVGMRHYTYISTLRDVLQTAAEHHKRIVVLDRPNLLGGCVEGPLVDPELHSFISAAPIPLRHGMTVGELACYFNRQVLKKPAQLEIVKMKDYQRTYEVPQLLVGLSPNLQSINACRAYSFLGLLSEIRPFDVGIKTNAAFQCLLLPDSLKLPWHVWDTLREQLLAYGIKATPYRYFSERKKQRYTGLRFSIDRAHIVPAFKVFLAIVHHFQQQGVPLTCSEYFDKAVGSKRIQQVINNKKIMQDHLEELLKKTRAFVARASYLYEPKPMLVAE